MTASDYVVKEWRSRSAILILAIILSITLIYSVTVGPMNISFMDSLGVVLSHIGLYESTVASHVETIIESIRLPRTLLGAIVGAALAVSGAAIQGVFRNPLADPGLIGVSGGAALAAVAVIVLGGTTFSFMTDIFGNYALLIAAFCGGFLTTLVVAKVATTGFGTSITTMLLAGIAINIVTGAGVGILTYMADDAQLRTLTFWSMGSLGGANWESVLTAGSLILLTVLLLPRYAKELNALLLGESESRHLGIEVEKVRRNIIILCALAVGAAVAVSGMIGFVGLVVPHLVRLTLGPDHRYLFPASALLGAFFLLLSDMFARTILAPAELPIGLITAIIGGPFFIFLIVMRSRKGGI